jgi:hypothetical protein
MLLIPYVLKAISVREVAAQVRSVVVDGVTELTTRWARRLPHGNTVASGLGLWPLLAILAKSADEPGRSELAAAVGSESPSITGSEDLKMALGLWVSEQLKLAETFGEVTGDAPLLGTLRGDPARDKRMLDAWVSEHTDGLIREMPLEVTPDLMLVLASALVLRTRWVKPFTEHAGRLTRVDDDLDTVRFHDRLTVVTVHGAGDVDVRLGVGAPEARREDVLAGLLAADPRRGTPGARLLDADPGTEVAPAVTVTTTSSHEPDVQLSLPSFEVTAEHDLLENADLFGLETVSSPPGETGHFSSISPEPLRVSQARQVVMARFFAEGFEASAVTAIGMVRAAFITPEQRRLSVDIDRPFAFAAFHRPTNLPIVVGWIEQTR